MQGASIDGISVSVSLDLAPKMFRRTKALLWLAATNHNF
jgi:hypothetical protein